MSGLFPFWHGSGVKGGKGVLALEGVNWVDDALFDPEFIFAFLVFCSAGLAWNREVGL